MKRTKALKIGNASGYWGDDPAALARQVKKGDLDYITMDFLAEITMSIMQKQRNRDPKLGYAKDFLPMLAEIFPLLLERKIRIITNAGGVNPFACAEAIDRLATSMGLKVKVAVVYGDDILPRIDELVKAGSAFKNMETGETFDAIRGRVEAANVYFGAQPVVEALKLEPDIIITGRVTDTGITLAAMIHEFGWAWNDWNRLSAGIVAGHIMECGSQATGGNFTDWHKVPSFDEIGYPVVEMSEDGTFIVTKHEGTGGLVSVDTVREQLFYEMGNPKAYITPDVVADFSSIRLKEVGPNRIQVYGVQGFEPTPLYKISMAYADGYKSTGMIAISGPRAREKAEAFSQIFWQRFGETLAAKETEYVGWNACHRSLGHRDEGNEILLRLCARDQDSAKLLRFGKLIPSLILSGPPGVAVIGGAAKPAEVVSYWPALMDKNLVHPQIALYEPSGAAVREQTVKPPVIGNFVEPKQEIQLAAKADLAVDRAFVDAADSSLPRLEDICLARSGDKGDTCNIGVMARSPEAFEFLDRFLTAQRVKTLFQELCLGRVLRYRLENMQGFNFMLEDALGGGGTLTLRLDAQGKTFAQALLRQHAPIPKNVLQSCGSSRSATAP